jgi:hypothetical protein
MTSAPSMAAATAATWSILPHVCSGCFGRLLASAETGGTLIRCSECGAQAEGGHECLCACGALPPGSRVRLRCIPNENRTPESPSEIVVVEAVSL